MAVRLRRRGAEAFADRVEAFSEGLRESEERTAKLLGGEPPADSSTVAALEQSLQELRIQHEELIVAEEQLRAQLDELGRMGLRLEAERERYADLFDRAPDAYLVTDRLGVVRDANAATVELLAVEVRFLRGKPIASFVPPSSLRMLHELLESLERGVTRVVDLSLRSRSGPDARVVAHVSLTARGQRVLWSFREVAEPQPFAAAPPDVERMLRDKEELLARERRAREELERANRAKDRFIAVLSHDLRAPLNAILGWTQLLRREVLDQNARNRAFETIERNARTQAKLIEELLDISRMAADRVQLSLGPIDVGALAQRVIEGALPRTDELGLELRFNVEPGLTVIGDRQRLEQVLSNVVANAIKYTPPPGRIEVDATRDGRYVKIVVRDTGKGIEPALLPHIFDMYTQERNYLASRSGLGLGLYIVKQLVELHDGSVSAESEGAERGAAFTIHLPVNDEVAALPSEIVIEPPVALRDLRILVVDDEEDARELVATILRRAGADVACASCASTALDLFSAWTPDIVVSDLAMPGGDGCDLIVQLRDRDPTIASIAVSGFTAEHDADRALAAGFDAHMSKPVDAAELVLAVYEAARTRLT
jgi:signal transduction histidine kinase